MKFILHLHLTGSTWGASELTGALTFASNAEDIRFEATTWEDAREKVRDILSENDGKRGNYTMLGGNLVRDVSLIGRDLDTLTKDERRVISFTTAEGMKRCVYCG